MTVRSEVRWDNSNVDAPSFGIFGLYDDFTSQNQITSTIDIVATF